MLIDLIGPLIVVLLVAGAVFVFGAGIGMLVGRTGPETRGDEARSMRHDLAQGASAIADYN